MKYIKEFFDFEDSEDYYVDKLPKDDFNIIKNILEEECSDAIKLMKNGLLYRGIKYADMHHINGKYILGMYVKEVRKNRRAKDTSSTINTLLNDEFEKQIGIRLREECVFATRDVNEAGEYKSETEQLDFIIFPIGKFDYYLNTEVDDLYGTMNKVSNSIWYNNYSRFSGIRSTTLTISISEKEHEELRKTNIENIVSGYVKNADISDFKGEVCIICDKYYLVDSRYLDEINKLIYDKKL